MNMRTYIGTKTVQARPMMLGEYSDYRGWPMPANGDGAETGYLVEYLDGGKANDSRHAGYISWSPSEVFERAYREVPTDHRQRVRDERESRAAELDKLTTFLGGEVFAKLPEDEKSLLLRQANIMRELCDVLGERIAAFDRQD